MAATAHCLPRRAVSFHFESTLGWRAVTRRHQRTLTCLDAPRGVLLAQQAHAPLTALTSSQKLSSHGLALGEAAALCLCLELAPSADITQTTAASEYLAPRASKLLLGRPAHSGPQNTRASRVLHSCHAAVTCTITKRDDAPSKAHAPTSAGTCRAAHHMQPQTCTY